MKLEFLAHGSIDCPLIRLYEFQMSELDHLRAACQHLAAARIAAFTLHEQPWIEPVEGCQLIWRTSSEDVDIRLPQDGKSFVLEFTADGWLGVADKLSASVVERNCFDWLTNGGDVEPLISRRGTW